MATITTQWVAATRAEMRELFLSINRKRLRFWTIGAAFGFVLLIVGLAASTEVVAVPGAILGFAGLSDVWVVRRYVDKQLNDPQNRRFFLESRAIIDEERIALEATDGTKSEVPWTSVISIEQTGENYLLYLSKMHAIIMLRRGQSEEDWKQFTEWAERRREVAALNLLNRS